MQNEKILIDKKCQYLSDSICHLPSHKIINKGITGCGGTTLELKDDRNSLVLSPTKNLVISKASKDILGVTGDTNDSTIKNYLMTKSGYKKIIATYDALPRLMKIIPNYQEYFLLIDEYHLLFNDYSFRNDAIVNILQNFTKFNDWAFLTATPLKPECILEELKDIPQITYEWQNAVPVKLTIKDTFYVQKELIELINLYKDRNLHIFLNSIATINSVVKKLDNPDYRVVCSANSKTKIRNYAEVNSEVKPINFYTSCAFEGCLLPNEKVLTDSGLKNASEVNLLDKLVNKNGDYVKIINLQQYQKTNEEVYTLQLGNTFRKTTFTKIHPILVSDHPLKSKFNYIECKDLKKGQWTIYPNIYNKEHIINNNDWDGLDPKSINNITNPLNTKLFWWFIGLYLGDGWTQNDGYRVFISVNKKEFTTIENIKKFCKLINRGYMIKSKSENCDGYIINCKQLVDFLNINFGKYSYGKRIPEKYKFINHNYKIALLNGYLDSDGCVIFTNNNYRGSFVSINLKLLEDFQDIITSLGLKSSLKKLRSSGTMQIEGRKVICKETYDLNISHNDLVKLYYLSDKCYQKIQQINLTSELLNKRNPRFVNMDFSDDLKYVYFKIKNIEINNYTGFVYNYECDTHSYCCRHITTHNCDIYDKNGLCIILSDTNIATTVLDIATKVRQVCGRLRDSKYKDECILILNTNKHRYAGTTKTDFNNLVSDSKRRGQRKAQLVNELDEDDYITELKLFSEETYYNLYLNKHDNKIFYDDNLRKLDLYNYDLITEIYSNSLSVLKEAEEHSFKSEIITTTTLKTGLSFIYNKLKELDKSEYTYEELELIFKPLFLQKNLSWSTKAIIQFFPEFKKLRKQIDRKRITIYKFIL